LTGIQNDRGRGFADLHAGAGGAERPASLVIKEQQAGKTVERHIQKRFKTDDDGPADFPALKKIGGYYQRMRTGNAGDAERQRHSPDTVFFGDEIGHFPGTAVAAGNRRRFAVRIFADGFDKFMFVADKKAAGRADQDAGFGDFIRG